MNYLQNLIVLTLTLFLSNFSSGQFDFKQLKKSIPVKGIKSIEPVYSNYLVMYRAKKDTGIYDMQSRKIIFHHVREFEQSKFRKNWFEYQSVYGYGVYDVAKSSKLIHSNSKIWFHYSSDSNLVNVVSEDVYGFLDRSRNAAYCSSSLSRSDTTFFIGHYEDPSCFLTDNTVSYGYGDFDGYEKFSVMYPLSNFIVENSNVFSKKTGALVRAVDGICEEWNDLIIESTYNGDTYYDLDFNQIIGETATADYGAEELSFLIDPNIDGAEYAGSNGIYKCKLKGKTRFCSIHTKVWVSPQFNHVFPIGKDFNNDGHSFFTVNENVGFGFFNTYTGVVLKAVNAYVEKRAFADGTFWFRSDANNEFTLERKHETDPIVTKNIDPLKSINSTIISHLGVFGSNLVVSPRSTSADTHDAYYYTATNFDKGAGVFDLRDMTWRIKPKYHTFTPFKGHFIAMRIGSTYNNASWLETTIFDGAFQIVNTGKYGASFIFNNRLFMLKGSDLIEYDIKEGKEIKRLGALKNVDADFKIEDGYFFIGNNNYRRFDKSYTGMDITDIINPKCELVKIPLKERWRYMSYIGEELIIIGKIKKSEPRDREIHRLDVDEFAIYDLRNDKLISPWCDRISLKYGGDGIYYNQNVDDDTLELTTSEIRSKLKLR